MSTAMPELSLRLCGRVSVTGDGVRPDVASVGAKSLALLAYLALEPGPHSRDKLATLLWGDYPDAKAKMSLRQALAHLRDAVPTALRVERTAVELAIVVDCDVTTFLRLAKESPRAAADIPVAGFLDGLILRHCPAFDEWADRTRAMLLRRAADVLAAAAREAAATRQWGDAIRFAERWNAIAPESSGASLALMEAHFMAGDPASAIDAFTRHRDYLARETGGAPDRSMTALLERIEATAATIRTRRQATEEWYATAPSFEGSLFGRDAEWKTLTRAWSRAARGSSHVVIIDGDAGVGKTRLASDFLRWVTAEGGTVLRGRAYDVRGAVPFGAMIEALRSGIDAPGLAGTDPQWLAEVARVVPELRTRFRGLGDGTVATADRWRLFEGVGQLLSALGEEAPVAIFIDDLQWCDADSCNLLHSLIRSLANAPLLWCLTFSSGSIERDAPATRLVRALRASATTSTIVLAPLSEEDVWQLIRGLGRVTTPNGARRLASRIHEVTSGFPFYVIELLKTLFAQGWLTVDPETGEWIVTAQATESAALGSMPTLHEAIAERIHCLPDELSAVLISLAVSGSGCRAAVLSHVHGISRLRAAMTCDALVERHLAVEDDGVYRSAHPLIARVVSDALGTTRRREVNRGLALSMELAAAEGAIVLDAGEVARHAEQGGERALAYRYGIMAASAADARAAHEEALTWLDFSSGVAMTAADTDAVNQMTARIMAGAGLPEPPNGAATPAASPGVEVTTLELPARI
jgi:DNA-binding SARP family transcriptional activator